MKVLEVFRCCRKDIKTMLVRKKYVLSQKKLRISIKIVKRVKEWKGGIHPKN